ncbi:MAG: hypothetical protein DWQ06_02260 [Calditrichaeota bacterium]|nr:MAG: hypothetical protein DWQ06_02260 [Calditrichota bacterium]
MKNILALTLFFLTTSFAFSLPRYATEIGANCSLCHTNPTGGGIRNNYGTTVFSKEDLALKSVQEYLETDFDGEVNDFIFVGADLGTTWKQNNKSEFQDGFGSVKANLYVTAKPNRILNFYSKIDLSGENSHEVFGLLEAENSGVGVFIKIGKFAPDFGLKVSNQTYYTRNGENGKGLDFDSKKIDTGIQFGISPFESVQLLYAFSDGNSRIGNNLLQKGSSKDKAHTIRAEFTKTIRAVNFSFGGTYRQHGYNKAANLFGTFGFWRLVWNGDLTFIESENAFRGLEIASLNEVFFKIKQGLYLSSSYELYDPNHEVKNDKNGAKRFGFGLDFYPFIFTKITAKFRHEKPFDSEQKKTNSLLLGFNFWF